MDIIETGFTLADLAEVFPARKRPDPELPSPYLNTSFYLEGDDLNPDAFTERSGLKPTEITIKGQKNNLIFPPRLAHLASRNGFHKFTTWEIKLWDRRYYSTDEGLSEVLEILWPRRNAILEYLEAVRRFDLDVSAGFNCNVHIYKDRPVYEFLPESIRKVEFFGLGILMDIYDYTK